MTHEQHPQQRSGVDSNMPGEVVKARVTAASSAPVSPVPDATMHNPAADNLWAAQLSTAIAALPPPQALRETQVQDSWQVIQRRLDERRSLRRQRQPVWAAAALLLLAFGLWRLVPPSAVMPPLPINPTALSSHAEGVSTRGQAVSPLDAQRELQALMGLSQQLEAQWQRQLQRPRTLSGAEVERELQLAGLIATLDARLGAAERALSEQDERALWRQRVVLMNELIAGDIQPEFAVVTL